MASNPDEMSAEEYQRHIRAQPPAALPAIVMIGSNPVIGNPGNQLSADEYQRQHRKKKDEEHRMQCQIVADFRRNWPDYAELLYAITNGSKLPYSKNKKGERYSPEAIRLLTEGMRPGIPDLHLAVARGGWHGLYVENKILPNQPTAQQMDMMERLTRQGYYCQVNYTREAAAVLFRNYLELPVSSLNAYLA